MLKEVRKRLWIDGGGRRVGREMVLMRTDWFDYEGIAAHEGRRLLGYGRKGSSGSETDTRSTSLLTYECLGSLAGYGLQQYPVLDTQFPTLRYDLAFTLNNRTTASDYGLQTLVVVPVLFSAYSDATS